MLTATWIEELLETEKVPYQECHHPEAFTAQQVAQREHMSGHRVAKTVIVMADDRPVELVLPASRRIRLDRVRELVGAADVRLASEVELARYFADCELGAIPPLRHWKDVEVLMDESMKVEGEILFQAATHRDAVRMNFADWFRLVQPRIGRFTDPEALPRE